MAVIPDMITDTTESVIISSPFGLDYSTEGGTGQEKDNRSGKRTNGPRIDWTRGGTRMGKKKEYPPIQTSAYIRVNGKWTDTRELNPEQKERLGTKIHLTLLRQQFPGYEFWVDKYPDL